VHLDTGEYQYLQLNKHGGEFSYLVDANGKVESYKRGNNQTEITLRAHVPLQMRIRLKKKCSINVQPPADIKSVKDSIISFTYSNQKDANVTIVCY
jgi:hypothetical protein